MDAATPSAPVEGVCQPGFQGVRDAFATNFANGSDVGASVAVTIDGELAVDLWGGAADAGRTTPWAPDTLVGVFSTTKTMTALTALWLADQGALDLEAPVARYWPEFAAAGKDTVTVRQLVSTACGVLANTGGVPLAFAFIVCAPPVAASQPAGSPSARPDMEPV